MARFLVVDDDENTVWALRELLTLDGHDVAAFSSAPDALEALERGTFDVVLTDLEMPLVRGDRVARAARARHPCACIFVLTGSIYPRQLSEACSVQQKPVEYAWISQAVSECPVRESERPAGCRFRPDRRC